jgi:hypothetical protein
VGQASGRNNSPQTTHPYGILQDTLPEQELSKSVPQGAPNTGDFEGMSQSVMHEDFPRQGKNLGFVLHPAESCRKNNPVVIALILASVILRKAGWPVTLTQPSGRQKLIPIHHDYYFRRAKIAILISNQGIP